MPVTKPTTPPPTGTIGDSRPCLGCGYDLRGLPVGGTCPECGLPIAVETHHDEPLAHSPVEVIKTFRLGCWSATIVLSLAAVAIVSRPFGGVPREGLAVALGVLSLLWLGAVWVLTPAFTTRAAASRGFGPTSRLRTCARLLQLAWPACAAFYGVTVLYANQLGGWIGLARLAMIASAAVGFAGIVCVGVLLERLAEWTRDDDAERAINLALWGVPATTVVLFLNVGTLFILNLVVAVIWFACVLALPYGMLSLSRSVTMSVSHAREYQERLRRRYERQQEYVREVADTVEKMDEARDGPH